MGFAPSVVPTSSLHPPEQGPSFVPFISFSVHLLRLFVRMDAFSSLHVNFREIRPGK